MFIEMGQSMGEGWAGYLPGGATGGGGRMECAGCSAKSRAEASAGREEGSTSGHGRDLGRNTGVLAWRLPISPTLSLPAMSFNTKKDTRLSSCRRLLLAATSACSSTDRGRPSCPHFYIRVIVSTQERAVIGSPGVMYGCHCAFA